VKQSLPNSFNVASIKFIVVQFLVLKHFRDNYNIRFISAFQFREFASLESLLIIFHHNRAPNFMVKIWVHSIH